MKRMYWITILLSLATLMLKGCASVNYEPVRHDSSLISRTCPLPSRADLGNCTVTLVKASQWESSTGIKVKAGERVCVQVPPGQVWFDWDRRNVPPHGEAGTWVMNLFTKRHPGAGFFSLIVNTKKASDGTLSEGHSVESHPQYVSQHSGELVFYPNDALGGPNDPEFFYRNNAGQVWVIVRPCVGACTCPGTLQSQ